MENEHFYGWGRDDGERVIRAKNFGFGAQVVINVLILMGLTPEINVYLWALIPHIQVGDMMRLVICIVHEIGALIIIIYLVGGNIILNIPPT